MEKGGERAVNFTATPKDRVGGTQGNVKPSFTNPTKISAPSMASTKTAPNMDSARGLRSGGK